LLQRLRQMGIHTAVDTAGAVSWAAFQKVMPVTDLFLYDLKAMNSAVHQQAVGVAPDLILDNYKRLIQSGAHVWIRVPVIPGVNDDAAQMDALYELLKTFPPDKVELLPYHAMGEHKYVGLGKELVRFTVPDQQWMEEAKQRFAQLGNA